MPQTFEQYNKEFMDVALPGMCANSTAPLRRLSRMNTGGIARQTVDNITIGGTPAAAASISITLTGTDNIIGDFTETVTLAGVDGETLNDYVARLAIALGSNARFANLMLFTANGADIEIEVRANRTIGTLATAGVTLTATTPTITGAQAAALIQYGYVVARYPAYGDNQVSTCRGATDLEVMGIAMRYPIHEAEYPYRSDAPFGFPPQSDVLIHRGGPPIWVPYATGTTPVRTTEPTFDPATGLIHPNGAAGMEALAGAKFHSNPNTSLGLIEITQALQ